MFENNKALSVTQSCLVSMGFNVVKGDGIESDLVVDGIFVKLVKVENQVGRPRVEKPADLQENEAFCHCCGARSSNVEKDFGFRRKDGKIVRQSHCRTCRGVYASRKVTVVKGEGQKIIRVDLDAIASNDLGVMYHEVLKIAKAVKATPPERRVRHAAKRAESDDYEGIVMRLTQFQRTFNPPEAIMKKYEPLLAAESARAARRYHKLLGRIGEDVDDLNNIARVYFVSYWFQHAQKDGNEMNERMLVYNIRQQFSRWYQVTWAKLKNVDFSGTGVPVNEYTSTPVPGAEIHGAPEEDRGEETVGPKTRSAAYSFDMEDLMDRSRHIRSQIKMKGKRAALRELENELSAEDEPVGFSDAALEAGLGSLPHDVLLERLSVIVDSEFIDFEARRLAKKKLQAHQAGCNACQPHQSLVK